jgi:AcrR family transcriptional regulator
MPEEETTSDTTAARGRPRCPLAQQAILCAATSLMEEVGFAALTMEGIAARAGVGKATIYRRWHDKGTLILDAIITFHAPSLAFEDTGDTREDFRSQLRRMADFLNGPRGAGLVALLGASPTDPRLAEAFRELWLLPACGEAQRVLRRGITRGQVRPDAPIEDALDALYGALYYRRLTNHRPLTPAFADSLVDTLFAGLEVRG